MGGVALAVARVNKQAISPRGARRFERGLALLRMGDQAWQALRLRFEVAPCLQIRALFHDLPGVGERIAIGIADLRLGGVTLPRLQVGILMRGLAIEPGGFETRASV